MELTLSGALGWAHLILEAGIIGLLFKLNYAWNAILDRVDLMYKQYCDEHDIPFKPLNNGNFK